MHKKVLNLKPRENILFNVEKTSEMKNLKKTYETLQSTIVIHIMHVGKRNNHIKKLSRSIKKKTRNENTQKSTTHLESTKRNKTIHVNVNEMKRRQIKISMAMERSGNVCQK